MAKDVCSSMMKNETLRGGPSRFCDGLLSAWRHIARRLQLPGNGAWLLTVIFLSVILAVGIGAAVFFDPKEAAWFPKCPIHSLTGLKCPGCGTGRAVHAVAHGRWLEAFRLNPILALAIPFLIAIIARPEWAKKPSVSWGVFTVSVLWMLVRNIADL